MFIPHKYGTKTFLLGLHDPYPFQCPNCRKIGTVEFAITGEYFHFWYIPCYAVEKDGIATCSECEFRINSIKYNQKTADEFNQIKGKFRFPFYTYTGITIFLSPVIVLIILLLFK